MCSLALDVSRAQLYVALVVDIVGTSPFGWRGLNLRVGLRRVTAFGRIIGAAPKKVDGIELAQKFLFISLASLKKGCRINLLVRAFCLPQNQSRN